MARFMKPQLFDEPQRERLEQILADLGIGDEEGRRIFVFALEYELAEYEEYRHHEEPAPSPPPPPAGSPLGEAARRLAAELREGLADGSLDPLLEALSRDDPLGRRYDRHTAEVLEALLERIAELSGGTRAPPSPTLGAAERRLLGLLAKAYNECFEEEPTPDPHGPFARLLEAIFRETGLELHPGEAELREVITG